MVPVELGSDGAHPIGSTGRACREPTSRRGLEMVVFWIPKSVNRSVVTQPTFIDFGNFGFR